MQAPVQPGLARVRALGTTDGVVYHLQLDGINGLSIPAQDVRVIRKVESSDRLYTMLMMKFIGRLRKVL